MRLADLVSWLDETLDARSFKDYGPNGLQVVGADEVTHLATAVSVSLDVIERAITDGAQALLVHHGLFWQGDDPVIGQLERRRLQTLFAGDLSLLAYHLPLDAHPTLGNNALLADLLGLVDRAPFGEHGGVMLGVQGAVPSPTPVGDVAAALGAALGGAVGPAAFEKVAAPRVGDLYDPGADLPLRLDLRHRLEEYDNR